MDRINDDAVLPMFLPSVECTLAPLPGKFHRASHPKAVRFTSHADYLAKRATLPSDQAFDSVAYGCKIQLPFVPATNIEYCGMTDLLAADPAYAFEIPEELQQPLIQSREGDIIGLKSGIRSAIVPLHGKYYRLKGCGNNADGFPLKAYHDYGYFEIRGCMFEPTAARAIGMSFKFQETMDRYGLKTANRGLGFYWYETDRGDDEVPKCCGVSHTIGEKRLNDHVTLGLERILPIFVASGSSDSLFSLFPDPRKTEVPDSAFPSLMGTHMVKLFGEDFGDFVDARNSEDEDLLFKIPESPIPQVQKDAQRMAWEEAVRFLGTAAAAGLRPAQVFGSLYFTLGYETGVALRAMHDANCSWGTYEDALGFHCNAHSNNMALLFHPEKNQILAPLDFDLAYTKESFVRGDEKYAEYTVVESKMLLAALAGGGFNDGASELEDLNGETEEDTVFLTAFRLALRDTMALGFEKGYAGEPRTEEVSDAMFDCWKALLAVGLIATTDTIA